jgi:hypothetical protein
MIGVIQRVMRFQSFDTLNGITGWMSTTSWVRSAVPISEVEITLHGDADKAGDGILRRFSQFLRIRGRGWCCLRGNRSSRRTYRCILRRLFLASDQLCLPGRGRRLGIRGQRARGRTWRGQDNLIPLETEGTVREARQCVDVHIRLAVHLENRNLARLAGYDKRQVLLRILRPGQPRQDQKRNQHQYCLK